MQSVKEATKVLTSPKVGASTINKRYTVKALSKHTGDFELVDVVFWSFESCECGGDYRAAKRVIDTQLPGYYLPPFRQWYVEDLSKECPF